MSGARQWSHMASQMACGVMRLARRLRTKSTAYREAGISVKPYYYYSDANRARQVAEL